MLIQKLSFQQQIILTLIYVFVKRTEALQIPYLAIVEELKRAYGEMKLTFCEDTLQGISELESYDIISIRKKSKMQGGRKFGCMESQIFLKVGFADIEAGISSNAILSKRYLS